MFALQIFYHRALKTAREIFNSLWEKYVHNNMIENSGERGALKFKASLGISKRKTIKQDLSWILEPKLKKAGWS